MLLLAAMAAAALGLTLQVLGDYLVETVYGSEKRQVQRLQETIDSFRTYVREEEVASTNVEKIGGWNWEHPFIQLTVSANGAILNSSQWGAELVDSDSGLSFAPVIQRRITRTQLISPTGLIWYRCRTFLKIGCTIW